MTSLKEKFDLTGKTVVITGGAGLLGQMHGEAVAEAGGIPVLVDIQAGRVKNVAKQIAQRYSIECLGVKVDITKEADLKKLVASVVKRYKSVDVLINNAADDPKVKKGSAKNLSRLENFSLKQWQGSLSVGLTGTFLCSQIIGRQMAKQKSGVILNIASDLGIIAPDQRIYRKKNVRPSQQPVKPVTYSVVKHGLIGLTKYCATYWAQDGVRVNAICPGGVYNDQPKEFVQKLTQLIPMGRMAQKDEYKAAVLFLISDASSYMTGSSLVIDGGRTCW